VRSADCLQVSQKAITCIKDLLKHSGSTIEGTESSSTDLNLDDYDPTCTTSCRREHGGNVALQKSEHPHALANRLQYLLAVSFLEQKCDCRNRK